MVRDLVRLIADTSLNCCLVDGKVSIDGVRQALGMSSCVRESVLNN